VTFGASFAESFASLSTSGHLGVSCLSTVLQTLMLSTAFGPLYIPATPPPDWPTPSDQWGANYSAPKVSAAGAL
jgi:hypothetical protein